MSVLYLYDDKGRKAAVLIPIADWEAIQARLDQPCEPDLPRDETDYLLSSPAMKKRLLEALDSRDVMPWDEVKDALGL